MTTILLFGAEGQVGWELQRSLSIHGTVNPLTRTQVNLAVAAAVRAAIRSLRPGIIINAAAYTAVDKAETEAELAFAINAAAPQVMAEEARAAGIPLIHYSTDYAYDGRKAGRYVESDATSPQSVYARSKLAGDEAILASGAQAVILRTSWVYAARGANFLRTMLRLASERESLRVVGDQFGAPTSAELLADVTASVLTHMESRKADSTRLSAAALPLSVQGATAPQGAATPYGLFHCTAAGETSWHGYASYIVAEAHKLGASLKVKPDQIEAISTEQYPVPAVRPKNSRLDCAKLEHTFGLQLPPWQLHVQRALRELLRL
jgi:dTDP-4-dehydrorhamnose reductase